MPPVGFEPTISAGERLQTYALDRAATGSAFIRHVVPYIAYVTFLRSEYFREHFAYTLAFYGCYSETKLHTSSVGVTQTSKRNDKARHSNHPTRFSAGFRDKI